MPCVQENNRLKGRCTCSCALLNRPSQGPSATVTESLKAMTFLRGEERIAGMPSILLAEYEDGVRHPPTG
jgi:hypothetical protein